MSYKPGVYDGIDNKAYHADPALGSTSLKTLALRTPAHYKHERNHPKTSDAFTFGTAVHSLTLEDDTSKFEIIDAANWLTKAAKEAKTEALNNGRLPLLTKEYAAVVACRDSVMRNPIAREAFTNHRAEASVFHDDNGFTTKCRPDAWKPGQLVDLKTTVDANPNEFGKTAYKFGYFMSGPHYIDTVKHVTGEDSKFLFVNVEKEPPYLVSVTELDDVALSYGRDMLDRAKRIYQECEASGEWPGYQPHTTTSLPTWAGYQLDDLLGLSAEMEV